MNLNQVAFKENNHSTSRLEVPCVTRNGSSPCNRNINILSPCVLSKTPTRGLGTPVNKTPQLAQGPTLGKSNIWKSPLISTPQNLKVGNTLGDRLVPSRSTTDFEAAHLKMTSENFSSSRRVLSYRVINVPVTHESINPVCKPRKRFIRKEPDQILDAPSLLNDYYLNVLDWSTSNLVCVALDQEVYLWNAVSGSVHEFAEAKDCHVSSTRFSEDGRLLAVGLSNGIVEVWDVQQQRCLENMNGSSSRIASLAWNDHIVTTGSQDGQIQHHDVRTPQHHVSTLAGHTGEVCALKWSGDRRRLASGSNDNWVNIWEGVSGHASRTTPLYALKHQAAVKGMAWCPWQNNLLATGSGTSDRKIRFWDMNTGECVNSIDTKSQVSGLFWNTEYSEIITSHGSPHNNLQIWKYPTMNKVADLSRHEDRILHLAMSPEETAVMSASADETLSMWNCFQADPNKKKVVIARKDGPRSALDALSNFR